MAEKTKFRVTQLRGLSHKTEQQRATLRGLGLRRIGHTVEVRDTPPIRGMIMKVQHLVAIEALKGEAPLTGRRHKTSGAAPKAAKPTKAAAPTQGTLGFTGNLAAAAAVLGKKIKADDLKIVEGIGPAIEKLLHEGGIKTWKDLANTPAAKVKSLLDAGGPRMAMHNPATWAEQAKLLVDEKWEAFKKLTDELDGGVRK
jgi:ribosomal protein L30